MESMVHGSLIITLLAVVMVVCWIVLPFAIIGTKPLLRQLLKEQPRTNELLELRRMAQPKA